MSEWYDDRRNLAVVARYMGERGDAVEDVVYMLERPQKFEDDWLWCAGGHGLRAARSPKVAHCACPSDVCEAVGSPGCYFGEVVGCCRTCGDNGYHCYPDSDLPLIACPGEACATCDYRAGEQEAVQK